MKHKTEIGSDSLVSPRCSQGPWKVRFSAGLILLVISASCAIARDPIPESDHCPPDQGVALQVLGSGGPIADDARASSAYLVWVDGRARLMVDIGSGSTLRFGESGARFEDLELIAISHFHTDHSAGLPSLLKSGNFSRRERVLPISGPAGTGRFPGLDEFLKGLLDPEQGAYRYLSGYLDGSDDLVFLKAHELNHRNAGPQRVLDHAGLSVSALGVPHGIVPSIAYRVDVGGKSIVFGSDQNGSSAAFAGFAHAADILVAHMAIGEHAGRAARSLHATPSQIAAMASSADASSLLLSHFMARSLNGLEGSLALIGQKYGRKVTVAEDMMCLIP